MANGIFDVPGPGPKPSYSYEEFISRAAFFPTLYSQVQYSARCEERGWYPAVILNTWISYDENKHLVVPWLEVNCKKRWNYRHACFWEFEDADDAMMFRLTWGDRIDNSTVR